MLEALGIHKDDEDEGVARVGGTLDIFLLQLPAVLRVPAVRDVVLLLPGRRDCLARGQVLGQGELGSRLQRHLTRHCPKQY